MVQTSVKNASNPNEFMRSLGVDNVEHDSGRQFGRRQICIGTPLPYVAILCNIFTTGAAEKPRSSNVCCYTPASYANILVFTILNRFSVYY